ncbi:hypothetical protein ACHAXT_006308 [Thalassiosira profunda]
MAGRTAPDAYTLTPEQIATFHKDGCVTLPDVLTEEEVASIETVFDRFLSRDIPVPGKDFCDMSKPFGVPFEEWSIVNCMLPTTYCPEFRGNIFERLTEGIAKQLHPDIEMAKDYDQLLNKWPRKSDAEFAWHQDMGYWPGPTALGVEETATCTSAAAGRRAHILVGRCPSVTYAGGDWATAAALFQTDPDGYRRRVQGCVKESQRSIYLNEPGCTLAFKEDAPSPTLSPSSP